MKAITPWILATIFAIALPTTAFAKDPERKVQGTTLASTHDPALQITLPATAHYLGAARWKLYDVADAELHVFVDADQEAKWETLKAGLIERATQKIQLSDLPSGTR